MEQQLARSVNILAVIVIKHLLSVQVVKRQIIGILIALVKMDFMKLARNVKVLLFFIFLLIN